MLLALCMDSVDYSRFDWLLLHSAPKVKIATMYIDQPGGFPSSKPTPPEELPMGIRMAEK